MRHVAALSDVPDEALKSVIGDFKSEGATVTSILQDDGKWTVVAMFFGKRAAAEDSFEPAATGSHDQPPGSGRA